MPTPWQPGIRHSRRSFLVASAAGLGGLPFVIPPSASLLAGRPSGVAPKANSTILFFLSGGASHIDMWDLKPEAPAEYRGPFQPIDTSAPGVRLSEHLPMLGRQAHHLAVVRSVGATVNTNDHHAGYYHNLTGHVPDATFLALGNNRTPMPDDWPFMGSVVGARVAQGSGLPNAVSLPQMPSPAPYTRPGQFAARLGVEYDPLYVYGDLEQPSKFQTPALVLEGDVSVARLAARQSLLQSIDRAKREFDASAGLRQWSQLQARAMNLLGSSQTTAAFDVSSEPLSMRERYGQTVNGMSLLLARRLAEAGVPFITVFWMEDEQRLHKKCQSAGGWDTHANNFNCLKDDLLPEFDRAFSALVEDLHERGMLDETLLLVTSEMGRTPKIGDVRSGGAYGAGRDHWTHCQSVVFAGGGIRGGQVYGATDRRAELPADNPVTPAHIAKTVYHAMGVHDLHARDHDGREFNLLDDGAALTALF